MRAEHAAEVRDVREAQRERDVGQPPMAAGTVLQRLPAGQLAPAQAGMALRNHGREAVGPRDKPNNARLTYACVGNAARVVSGPRTGAGGDEIASGID